MKKWKLIAIIWFDLTETERERGSIACYIKNNTSFNYRGSLSEDFENIMIDILSPKWNLLLWASFINKPSDQSSLINDFNVALK